MQNWYNDFVRLRVIYFWGTAVSCRPAHTDKSLRQIFLALQPNTERAIATGPKTDKWGLVWQWGIHANLASIWDADADENLCQAEVRQSILVLLKLQQVCLTGWLCGWPWINSLELTIRIPAGLRTTAAQTYDMSVNSVLNHWLMQEKNQRTYSQWHWIPDQQAKTGCMVTLNPADSGLLTDTWHPSDIGRGKQENIKKTKLNANFPVQCQQSGRVFRNRLLFSYAPALSPRF